MTETEFAGALNPEQQRAALAPDGPILVLAAAGTGKTRTLVYRVAHLVRRGVEPHRILLLTFTNKAAREMLARAEVTVGQGVGGIWGGTFHHLANRILRRHARRLGYESDFVILDRDDARGLVSQGLKTIHREDREFPRAGVLLGLFSAAANTRVPVEELARRRFESEIVADVVALWNGYEARKRELGAMDFDDLLVNALRLLREQPDVEATYRDQFVHVLVDEYQDTNPIQAELVDRLGQGARNVFVVGDDFQSIYAWRGADFRNIMTFPERYPDAQVYKLETNYRSAPEILDVANACIAGNPEQFQKTLRATRPAHGRPTVMRLRDGDEQARYVVERIRTLRREGYGLNDIAVLYRAHFHAIELERMLPRARLPYVITSGVRFFEQAHIKDALSLLRVSAYPADALAFARLLGLLPGVGERTAARIWTRLGSRFAAADRAVRAGVRDQLPAGARARWAPLERLLGELAGGASADAAVTGFVQDFYEEYATNTFENADQRLEDIGALAEDVARFGALGDFLSDVALLTNVDADMAAEENGGDAVRLSTIHQAKGLEWKAVIVLWATEGMFPSSRSLSESEDGEAEERRLFYVAVTRARDTLCLCTPEVRRMRDGGLIACTPSRFVTEVPRELMIQDRVGFIL